jgi:hypothetical protein
VVIQFIDDEQLESPIGRITMDARLYKTTIEKLRNFLRDHAGSPGDSSGSPPGTAIDELLNKLGQFDAERAYLTRCGFELIGLAANVYKALEGTMGREELEQRSDRYERRIESDEWTSIYLRTYEHMHESFLVFERLGFEALPEVYRFHRKSPDVGDAQAGAMAGQPCAGQSTSPSTVDGSVAPDSDPSCDDSVHCGYFLGRIVAGIRRGKLSLEARRGFQHGTKLSEMIVKANAVLRDLEKFRDWSDNGHLRGSFLIVACSLCQEEPKAFSNSSIWAEPLASDLSDSVKCILAAAEDLEEYLDAPVVASSVVAPDQVADKAPASEGASEELREGQEDEQERVASKKETAGETSDSPGGENIAKNDSTKASCVPGNEGPPDGFHRKPLRGEKTQIAWALKHAGIILARGTFKELQEYLKEEGQLVAELQRRNIYHVYVRANIPEEKMTTAHEELERIQSRLPYRHPTHELPRRFKKHRNSPLIARSEDRLAEVLYRVDILKRSSVPELRGELKRGGFLFGKYSEDKFMLYLGDSHADKLDEALKLLKSMELEAASAERPTPTS